MSSISLSMFSGVFFVSGTPSHANKIARSVTAQYNPKHAASPILFEIDRKDLVMNPPER